MVSSLGCQNCYNTLHEVEALKAQVSSLESEKAVRTEQDAIDFQTITALTQIVGTKMEELKAEVSTLKATIKAMEEQNEIDAKTVVALVAIIQEKFDELML